ncbi:MAG: GYD domain-containing protein [Proteobacteria bacterium]|nr:GYD domain-containing protein [Pseudomonadota bacterium]
MLFCLMCNYTPQALNAIMDNPDASRVEAARKLIEAAGGKLVSMYSTAAEGPGVMVIFDVADPAAAPAISGVVAASGTSHNTRLMRLHTADEIAGIRKKAAQLRGAYKPPHK